MDVFFFKGQVLEGFHILFLSSLKDFAEFDPKSRTTPVVLNFYFCLYICIYLYMYCSLYF